MNNDTAPGPETTETVLVERNPQDYSHPPIVSVVVSLVEESRPRKLVTLWTDWDRDGTNFPLEYLTEVIAALHSVQTKQIA